MAQTIKNRNAGFDVLRIICCLMVLFYHLPGKSAGWDVVCDCMAPYALAGFFMLTGALVKAPDPSKDKLWPFYQKMIFHLLIPLYLATVFLDYLRLQPLSFYASKEAFGFLRAAVGASFWRMFAYPHTVQLWFLYTTLGIYAIWPFIRYSLVQIGEKGQKCLLLLMVLIQLLIDAYYLKTGEISHIHDIAYLTGWLLYPMLSFILVQNWTRRYDKLMLVPYGVSTAICLYLIAIGNAFAKNPEVLQFSPIMLLSNAGVFVLFYKLPIKPMKLLSFISKRTFTMYIAGIYFTDLIFDRMSWTTGSWGLDFVVLFIVVLAGSSALDMTVQLFRMLKNKCLENFQRR